MFYSRFLLSKKGPLGTIWVAAHCHKRLKKDQICQTDVSSSVDKILHDAVPEVTYRIIAYLLLGVVRIFSKKVEFLLKDCCSARESMDHLAGVKVRGKTSKAKQAPSKNYYSISRPMRFELDAFDLEVPGDEEEDFSCCHVMPSEEIMLAGTSKGDGYTNRKNQLNPEPSFEAYSSIHTSTRDGFSPHSMDIDVDLTPSSRATSNLEQSVMDKFCGIKFSFSLEDHLEPMIFDDAEKDSGFFMPSVDGRDFTAEKIPDLDAGKMSKELPVLLDDEMQTGNHEHEEEPVTDTSVTVGPTGLADLVASEQSTEKHAGPASVTEERLELESLREMGEECTTLHVPADVECARTSLQKPEFVRLLDEELNVESNKMMEFPETSPLPDQVPAKHQSRSISVDVSPPFRNTDQLAVHTPSIKERGRVQKKRKCIFDEVVVLSNNVIKHWIDDPSNLVCKRRKAPVSSLQSWQALKISNLPRSLIEPLIPCTSVMLKSPVTGKNFIPRDPVAPIEVHLAKVTETPVDEIIVDESPVKEKSGEQASKVNTQTPLDEIIVEESPAREKSREQTPIAPATPVAQLAPLRSHEDRGIFRPDTPERPSSSESMEVAAADKDPDLITGLMDDDEDMKSSAGDAHENENWSQRTKKVAKYLQAKLQHEKKQSGKTFVNLTCVLKGKTRKESARLFYEILVLKTRDCVDVSQEQSFDDILVMETSKLKNSH